jgi:hypothetical protein
MIFATAPSLVPASGSSTTATTVDIALQYYLQVVGPSPGTPLKLLYTSDYTLAGAPTNQINVTAVVNGVEQQATCAGGCVSGVFSGSTDVRSGRIISTTIGAVAFSQNGGPVGIADIDPYFYLTPAEVAAGYSLVFSQFIGDASPGSGSGSGSGVPEPATLALFGTGLAGAAAMRRRKKKAA